MPELEQPRARTEHGLSSPLFCSKQIHELGAERVSTERGPQRLRYLLEVPDDGVVLL
jgi:hypothetical protein